MKKFIAFIFMLMMCVVAYSQDAYNSIATAYVTTTISQNVVFDNAMKQGGTFNFSVLAHNGGGRAGQSDTANVKIQFYTSTGALVTSVNSSYSANLPNPNAVCGNPCIDSAVPWSTLSTSATLTSAQAANVAYATISMYGIDGSYWAGDYGPWYRAPTFTQNNGANKAYNPEFGPYNGTTAQGWTASPGFGACQGAWGGSNACIVNSSGTPGTSTTGLVANQNGGGPSATGGTTSGQAGGYNSTMSTSSPTGAPPPPVNNTTAPGTMPGGFIGRVLNNSPATWQTYSFNYTPTVTGSQYVQLAFRQDPAYWNVVNISLKAAGSSTNLLTNGGFVTGGTITVQTNNGPVDIQTPTNWGVAYQAGVYPTAAGTWNSGLWVDGAVGSFDAIYQGVTLTAGVTYTLSFMVAGDDVATSDLSGDVQLGVYAGPCNSLTLSPDQCTLPSNSGYTTVATPSDGASAGAAPAPPTPVSSSTTNNVSSTSSVGPTTTINNNYGTFTVTGTSTPTTTTTTTTPVTTTYWSDGTTTTSNGTSSSSQTVTYNYTVTGPTTPPVSPNAGTNRNSVYITQVNAGANDNVTANQSGHGNYETVTLGGSNNTIRVGQGYTFSTSGIATERSVSIENVSGITVSGNNNTISNSQLGTANSTVLNVTGNSNGVTLTQNGNNNQAYSIINGNGNSLVIGQNGNSNIAAANLYGNNNTATVTQTGNNHGTVLNLINAGGANNVSVVQTGAGDAYSLQQICTNPAGCSVSVIRNK